MIEEIEGIFIIKSKKHVLIWIQLSKDNRILQILWWLFRLLWVENYYKM